jgi:antitoxin HigA-1
MSKSPTTTRGAALRNIDGIAIAGRIDPVHPGEILREDFLAPLSLSAGQVAKACHVPRTRIERVIREELGISADTALRLARLFGTSAEFWLNLQKRYEIDVARDAIGDAVEQIVPIRTAA